MPRSLWPSSRPVFHTLTFLTTPHYRDGSEPTYSTNSIRLLRLPAEIQIEMKEARLLVISEGGPHPECLTPGAATFALEKAIEM